MSECGRKIRNANRMPKSDDRTESNLRRGRREGGREGRWEEDKEEERGGGVGRGEEGRGAEGRRGGGERVTRAYTVEVQTASVFYAQSLILLLFRSIDPLLSLEAVKHGHTISAVGVEPCTGRLYFSAGTRFMSTSS